MQVFFLTVCIAILASPVPARWSGGACPARSLYSIPDTRTCLLSHIGSYFGGPNEETPKDVAVSPTDGSIYLLGESVSSALSHGSSDLVLVKYDGDGAKQWAMYYGGTDVESAGKVVVTSDNSVYVVGSTETAAMSNGDKDLIYMKFDSAGALGYAMHYGGTGQEEGRGIAATSDGSSFYVVGYTRTSSWTSVLSDFLIAKVTASSGAI